MTTYLNTLFMDNNEAIKVCESWVKTAKAENPGEPVAMEVHMYLHGGLYIKWADNPLVPDPDAIAFIN